MSTAIYGDFSKLYLREAGTTVAWKLIGCTTGDTFTPSTEMAEITNPDSNYVQVIPTYKSATLSSDALLVIATGGDPEHATKTLLQWQKDDQLLEFLFTYGEGVLEEEITGECYITNLNVNASANDYANVQIQLQCTGEWQLS